MGIYKDMQGFYRIISNEMEKKAEHEMDTDDCVGFFQGFSV